MDGLDKSAGFHWVLLGSSLLQTSCVSNPVILDYQNWRLKGPNLVGLVHFVSKQGGIEISMYMYTWFLKAFIKVVLSLSVRPSFRDFLRIKDGMYVALHKIIIGIWKISQSVRSGR